MIITIITIIIDQCVFQVQVPSAFETAQRLGRELWEQREREEGLEKTKVSFPVGSAPSSRSFQYLNQYFFTLNLIVAWRVLGINGNRRSQIEWNRERRRAMASRTHTMAACPCVVYTSATIYKQEIIPTPNGPCPGWTVYPLSFINLSPRCQQPRASAIRFHLPPVRIVAAMFADYFWRFLVGWMVFGLSEARLATRLDRWLGRQGKKPAFILSLKRFVLFFVFWSPLFLCWISRAAALK